jgi:uroporphyrinogen-III decarboxylase
MSRSKERLNDSLNHKQPNKIPVDVGSTSVTGIHVLAIQRLRDFYGLEKRPVRLIEPYQMLGEIENDLAEILHLDIIGILSSNTLFGFPNDGWKEYRTHWGQLLLVPGKFNTLKDKSGDFLIFPEGDTSSPPSGRMPKTGYFFDSIIRQEPVIEEKLNPEDNLEEFKLLTENDLKYWADQIKIARESGKGVMANFGGTALGDIALVPAPFMKYPKGIRDITEWYISTLSRPEYVKYIFEKQSEIAVENFKMLHRVVGNDIDAVFLCGTDFGTQNSSFCSPETFDELYLPWFKKMNDWIHENTTWKTFKHSCGAVEPFLENFITAGFDIINPVQINAAGMDPKNLKKKYGKRLVFWGGGVDTQKVLPFGTPSDVENQVLELCELFSKDGGFVFNTVHNIQANVPVENIAAIFKALDKFNSN